MVLVRGPVDVARMTSPRIGCLFYGNTGHVTVRDTSGRECRPSDIGMSKRWDGIQARSVTRDEWEQFGFDFREREEAA